MFALLFWLQSYILVRTDSGSRICSSFLLVSYTAEVTTNACIVNCCWNKEKLRNKTGEKFPVFPSETWMGLQQACWWSLFSHLNDCMFKEKSSPRISHLSQKTLDAELLGSGVWLEFWLESLFWWRLTLVKALEKVSSTLTQVLHPQREENTEYHCHVGRSLPLHIVLSSLSVAVEVLRKLISGVELLYPEKQSYSCLFEGPLCSFILQSKSWCKREYHLYLCWSAFLNIWL